MWTRSQLVLLPKDPDASARALRAALRERFGLDVAVIISDTMGRPWRNGLTDVALGAAGIDADPRLPRRGRPVRQRAADHPDGRRSTSWPPRPSWSRASATRCRSRWCAGYLDRPPAGTARARRSLVRDAASDLFSLGTAEARAAGLRRRRDARRRARLRRRHVGRGRGRAVAHGRRARRRRPWSSSADDSTVRLRCTPAGRRRSWSRSASTCTDCAAPWPPRADRLAPPTAPRVEPARRRSPTVGRRRSA